MKKAKETLPEFRNEPFLNFSEELVAKRMMDSIARVESEFGKEYPLIIDGKEVFSDKKFESLNPSNPQQVLGVFQKAGPKQGEDAIQAAFRAFAKWRKTPYMERVKCMLRAAEIMREQRFDLDATMILEVGKSWIEADADFAEAVDFLEYYARQSIKLNHPVPLGKFPNEENELVYIPLGVGVIIPPWNFPGAIPMGMTSSSLAAGNTVVLKPASDSPLIAYKMIRILMEAGIPSGVLNFVTGSGSEVGEYMVKHPKTRFISFTGSKEVGLRINTLAAEVPKGQIWIKRVILEMGGKDAIVVAEDADLEKAAEGITVSAFGYQGQKCSACSRAIIVESVYDGIVRRLVEGAKKLTVGPVKLRENYMGPVINRAAYEKTMKYIEIGKKEGRLLCGGVPGPKEGNFIMPTIIADVKPDSRIAQEEIFGPVLSVIKARDYEHAIEIANSTEYGLTGAVYTKDHERIRRAKEDFHVGNLYINRKCTGALVNLQPFGGFNMSGTDSKGGGPDYLLLVTQAKSIANRLK